MVYTKGQLTDIAKQIIKTNEALSHAIGLCESLSHDTVIQEILKNKDDYSDEYILLVERIKKYANELESADARCFGAELDDATDLLQIAYEEINTQ